MVVGQLIKKRRRNLGYTLEKLSQISNISVGYLSKIERSDKTPPLATLQRLASSLNVSVYELLEVYEPTKAVGPDNHNIFIVKNRHFSLPDQSEKGDSGYSLIQLTNNYLRRYMSPFMMHIPPGNTEEFVHDAEEFNFVAKGPVKLRYEGVCHSFDEGDSFYFDSRRPHSFINENDYSVLVLSVVYIYRNF